MLKNITEYLVLECCTLSLEHWEAIYRNGTIATGPSQSGGNYDLEVRQSWVDFFSNCRSGTRILDVASGNGAVAIIAAETARELGRVFNIHACDLALIQPLQDVPEAAVRLSGIQFHQGIPLERLHFPDASFDVVCGQYALEYTDTAASLKELHRVLAPDGAAMFILQHSASSQVQKAHITLREAEFVLNDTKTYRRLRQLISADQATPKFAQNAGKQLQLSIQAIKRALPEAQAFGAGLVFQVTLNAIHQILQLRADRGPVLLSREIDLAEGDLRSWVRRLKDLVASAKDENGMLAIEEQAAQAGFDVIGRGPQVYNTNELVGWKLLLRRK